MKSENINKQRQLSVRWTRALPAMLLAALAAAAQPGRADLSQLVVVGDSLSAGYQNDSLLGRQQVHGYAAVIAAQAGTDLALPLIAEPGIPNVLKLVQPGPPPVVVREAGVSSGRIDPLQQTMNLAVPFHTVQDALTTRPDLQVDSLTDLVLGLPGLLQGISRSQVEWAEALQPTTVIVWIGNNDALNAVFLGTSAVLTPVAQFQAAYTELLDRLAATGATLVVANIPDVAVIPFLTSAEQVAETVGLPLTILGPVLGIASGDFVTLDAFDTILKILQGLTPGPLPGNVVVDAGEVAAIRAATAAYNAHIAAEAKAKGAALVDIHEFLNSLHTRGLVVGGQRLTTGYLGGVFSLDGVHPTNTVYAALANEFIHALDSHFAAGIPPVNLRHVQKQDPLVFPGVGHPASALGHIDKETVESLRAVMVH